MLIDSKKLKQAILTIMPERSEVLLIVDNQTEGIVRCKDCKHHGQGTCSAAAGIAYPPPDDWFCADGERGERDAYDNSKRGRTETDNVRRSGVCTSC